ncbi:MAG: phosphate uptake regulator PhoU [Nitrososphaerota archaeon]|nr:phosphate uptake regulator PhoU [Nitrososphaerota archaeon]
MEIRRLQEMGGATLLVSVPKAWVRSKSLTKGSIVSIEETTDGGLLIYPVRSEGKPEKEIEIENPSRFGSERTPSEITAAYLLGYDLIHVKGKNRITREERERIMSSVKRLIGLEIVEEDERSITSQFLVDNTVVEPSKIVRRISSLVRAMITDTLKHVVNSELTRFETVAQRDDEIDRLHFLLVRLIRSAVRDPRAAGKYGLSPIDCLDYRVATSSLETAGDYAVELSNAVSTLEQVPRKMLDQISQISSLLDSMQIDTLSCFLSKDFEIAKRVFEEYAQLEIALKEFRMASSSPNLLHLVETIERIARSERDVADLVSPMKSA